jgi:hypothetical protein
MVVYYPDLRKVFAVSVFTSLPSPELRLETEDLYI